MSAHDTRLAHNVEVPAVKLSIMLFPFHRALTDQSVTAKGLLASFTEARISAIEPMVSWIRADPEGWDRFHRAALDAGMVYPCYDVGVNFVGDGPADRETALDLVCREVDFCRDVLSCPTVLLPGTRPSEGMSNEEGRRIYGDMLARASARTAGSGVTLTIENFGVYPHFAASAGHCMEVLRRAGEGVRFTFDNGNFLLGGDLPLDAYAATQERIAHVHIKDFDRREPDGNPSLTSVAGVPYKGCMIGDGDGQVRECLQALRGDGFPDWVSIEVGGGNPVKQAVSGARVIREAWGDGA